MKKILIYAIISILSLFISKSVRAECTAAHTHIGINPTWRPADWNNPGQEHIDSDPTDNNKLWFFSLPPIHDSATPGWPNWEHANGNTFLALTLVKEEGEFITKPSDTSKKLYTCSFTYSKAEGYGDPNGPDHINGWHSAHGPQGAWNLESIDANTIPAWDIYIKRERTSENLLEDDFFTLLHDDSAAWENNGDMYSLGKRWLSDFEAWGIHEHMGFYFWLDDEDEDIYIVFSAHDNGGLYQRSADFTIHFAKTVYQPVAGDLNGDSIVDINDFEIMIENWGKSGIYKGEDAEHHDHDHDEE
ncbi:MAG: hypothetical protein JW787_09510 [Sedimentisphaerales bacterium]|nr:hypothetical protein [Sedimentisphaerales bacterium]